MRSRLPLLSIACALAVLVGCGGPAPTDVSRLPGAPPPADDPATRPYLLERVEHAAIAQVYADGFNTLTLPQKVLAYHLYRAAVAGRDIYYDQRHRNALDMRLVLEQILSRADRLALDPATLAELTRYTKLFWLNSGPYDNLTAQKFVLRLTPAALAAAAKAALEKGAEFAFQDGASLDAGLKRLEPMFFDPRFEPIVTNRNPPPGQDILTASANNLYAGGVSMADLKGFTERFPFNSKLIKKADGTLAEHNYGPAALYFREIKEVIKHLTAAAAVAPAPTARALNALVRWYETGSQADRTAYDIAWVQDSSAVVDTINGFTEVYLDPRGVKGAWEGAVFYVNREKTARIRTLAANAQWFEDHMPWDAKYRKQGVTGITANAMDTVVETGEAGPITFVGVNLPNDQAVREQYGSKSFSLANINEAYDRSTPGSMRAEFAWSPEEAARADKWGTLSGELITDMHEVIGHASGKLSPAMKTANPADALGDTYSALEEARADLVGLYFIADPKLPELGVFAAADQAVIAQTEYEAYTRNALTQLRRVGSGDTIADNHLRNRQLVVKWLMAHTKAIEVRERDGKTFYVMVDAAAFRAGVGVLLAEIQRIKSEGDGRAARALLEAYGTRVDTALRDQVIARTKALNPPTYTGFVQPKLTPVTGADGTIIDVRISYPKDFTRQMLEYSGYQAP
ncbi:MAG: peptidase M49 [Vicinamibacterales bacterium]